MRRRLSSVLVLLVFAFALAPAQAQDAKFSKQQLDQMLAPIALYPDDLLTNVLMASTYPLDVVQAARWRKESGNANSRPMRSAKLWRLRLGTRASKRSCSFPTFSER